MLGHPVPFKYCRTLKNGLPCFKVLDCWFEIFEVQDFITDHYTDEEIQKIFTRPEPKITSIIDLIEKSKKYK